MQLKKLKGTWVETTIYAALMTFALTTPSFAQLAPVQTTLQQIISIFTGPIGTSLAVLSIIACGVMAFIGRFTWFAAISAIGGIVLVFGAANIVDYFKSAAGGN